jgi:hypothetical protein
MLRKVLFVCFSLAAAVAVALALLPSAGNGPMSLDTPDGALAAPHRNPREQPRDDGSTAASGPAFCDALTGTCVQH